MVGMLLKQAERKAFSRRSLLLGSACTLLEGCVMTQNDNDSFHPYVPMMLGTRGIAEAVIQTRLGNKVRITPYNSGESLNCYAGPPGVGEIARTSEPKMLFRQSLLRVSVEDLKPYSYLPGSWFLSIDARPVSQAASPFYPGQRLVSPVMAEVTFGTGAAAHTLQIDATANVLALPALDVTVDVGISQVCGLVSFEGLDIGLYQDYDVTAVLHKTAGLSVSHCTRTVLNHRATPVNLPVPNFAESWCYLPYVPVNAGQLIGNIDTLILGQSGVIPALSVHYLESVRPELVSQNARMHCYRTLHPFARSVSLGLDVGSADLTAFPGSFITRINY